MTNIFFCFSEVGRYVLSGRSKFLQSRSTLLVTPTLTMKRRIFPKADNKYPLAHPVTVTRFVHPSLLSCCPKQCQTIPLWL